MTFNHVALHPRYTRVLANGGGYSGAYVCNYATDHMSTNPTSTNDPYTITVLWYVAFNVTQQFVYILQLMVANSCEPVEGRVWYELTRIRIAMKYVYNTD